IATAPCGSPGARAASSSRTATAFSSTTPRASRRARRRSSPGSFTKTACFACPCWCAGICSCAATRTSYTSGRSRSCPLRRAGGAEGLAELRQVLVEAAHLEIRRDAEPLHGSAEAITPAAAVAEGLGARHVPRIRRDEEDLARGQPEGPRSQLVGGGRGLIGAHGVHREHGAEDAAETARAHRRLQQQGTRVGEDAEGRADEGRQRALHLGEGG